MKEFSNNYYDLLTGEYAGINLTRITDPEDFWNKQIVDSVAPLEQSQIFRDCLLSNNLHLDVGFGGGFPLLPLAKLNSEVDFLGFEARGKKAKVVNEIALKLGLTNVSCHHVRLETLIIDLPCSITLKAVGKVNDFLSMINTKNKVQVFFYKGPNFQELEKNQIEKAKNTWNIIENREINVQGTDKRYIIGFENKHVPHGTITPNKTTTLLSELVNHKKG